MEELNEELNENIDEDTEEITGKLSVPVSEQETHILIMRDEPFARIYSSDTRMLNKLQKLCKNSPDMWQMEKEDEISGSFICKDKKLVSLRSHKIKRNLTDEQRQELAERLKKVRDNRG